ncbi:NUDIX hydrolase [Acidisoma cellulosilytica]|uniref:NUDIX hydrolase n=1 Tax=Acidisoma cellulosilyticum TaxID=2802395 RepID=A0A963Z0H3_9PROT|nr:NUDIX hydrolase [Acidisoma cellulosilyticum]MCB8879747.1 NUDIX hydrolase [Acidisoma cellulosilyticum]
MSSGRDYPARPIVGIGIVLLKPPHEVLLIRRGQAPMLGAWGLPGGAQDVGETAEDAARRELLEETGLTVGALKLAGNVDSIDRDDAGRVRYHYTILDFAGLWEGGDPQALSDAADVTWADCRDLGRYDLWSEAHRIIALARQAFGV